MDEFDIEITNLSDRPAPTDTSSLAPDRETPEAASIGPRTLSAPPQSHRQRLFRALAIILPIVLALALILGANPLTRAALGSLLHPPVATFVNSTSPGAEEFDLVHVAPWGSLRIDGQIVPPKQVLQRFRAIRLAPGTHTLDYSAPPFPSLHCTLAIPANPTRDTCPMTKSADDLYMVSSDTARMLDLRAGFTNLSGQQLAALVKATGAGLAAASPTVTIAPGEHYLTAGGEIVTNTGSPMQVTLLYHLSTNTVRLLPGFPPLQCSPLCFYAHLFEQAPNEWGVLAPVVLSWSYAVPHGPIVSGPIDAEHDTLNAGIPLHITWQHGWHVTPLKSSQLVNASQADSPSCVPAQDALVQAYASIPIGSGYGYFMRPAPDATSCLIEWSMVSAANNNTPPCYLLYRFGVLLAVDDQAHRTFPTLPLASASEQSLARQLAAQS